MAWAPRSLRVPFKNGNHIQDLISPTNPHDSSVKFETAWDLLPIEPRLDKDSGNRAPKTPISNDL
jgi:hypothetical protein